MKLKDLAEASGVSTASIKYYIHVGILPPGRKRNATTAVYDDSHLHRLALIRWLRDELDTPIEAIAKLTDSIDDESLSTLELMGDCQEFALHENSGLPLAALSAATPMTPADSTSAAEPSATDGGAAAAPQRFADIVSEAIDRLGWPDEESAARDALARVLAMVEAAGYSVDARSVISQCRAVVDIAEDHIRPIGNELSRDEICLRVIRGITIHNRQLIATSALVHASLSIMARQEHS